MNINRIERFLSIPAVAATGPDTARIAREFCHRLRNYPTPRLRLMEDGAIRLRWLNGPREVKVYIRCHDVNFSIHSRQANDTVPVAVVRARSADKAIRIGLRWLGQKEGADG